MVMNSISKYPWQEHFSEFIETKESLTQLLSTGQLSEPQYLQWASEHYELPILQNNFFSNIDLKKIMEKYPDPHWDNTFFPAAEGNGIVYIACIEPKVIPFAFKHCYVLASFSILNSTWDKYFPKTTTKSVTSEPVPTSSLNIDFSSLAPTAPQANDTPIATSESQPLPSHLEITADLPSLEGESSDIPQHTSPTEPFFSPSAPPSTKATPSYLSDNAAVTLVNTAGPSVTAHDISFTSTKTIMPFPDKTKDFTFVRTVFTEETVLGASTKISEAHDPQDALIGAFKIMRDYLKKLMWCVRDNQGSVFPISCNSAWDFNEAAWIQPIDFKTPNPFRIAKLTAQAYHGPVAQNSSSDHFFKMWNNGKYPDQLTIVPVVLDEKVFSYFVGCDKGTHFHSEQSLITMEKVCNDLLICFQRIHKEFKKTAA